jgi:hypothetical protein
MTMKPIRLPAYLAILLWVSGIFTVVTVLMLATGLHRQRDHLIISRETAQQVESMAVRIRRLESDLGHAERELEVSREQTRQAVDGGGQPPGDAQ